MPDESLQRLACGLSFLPALKNFKVEKHPFTYCETCHKPDPAGMPLCVLCMQDQNAPIHQAKEPPQIASEPQADGY